ncbi:DUF488 family protein [Enhygromyxa salina]|nr:DUF488 family protein [Enhygromyxa salina]
MRENEDRPSLRVLEGDALGSGRGSCHLAAVAEEQHSAQLQLGLPGLSAPRSAVVCVTIHAMALRSPGDWVRATGARQVVDLRVAPSFRRLHMRRSDFVKLAGELGARYVHLAALANRYGGDSWHAERYRQQLERHLEENQHEVQELREMIEDGPVMLIVARRSSVELRALLRALEQISPSFEVQMCLGE